MRRSVDENVAGTAASLFEVVAAQKDFEVVAPPGATAVVPSAFAAA